VSADRERWLPRLTNTALAALWAAYAWRRLDLWQQTGEWVLLALVARNAAVSALFLCRRESRTVSRDPGHWVLAIGGTLLGFLYGGGEPVLPAVGAALMVSAALLGTVASLALGRSFGIVAANRGVKKRGPYALVRHPLYASYLLFDLGFLLQAASVSNGILLAAMATTTYLRARIEERVLVADPEYRAYAERTRYMFIPGLL
jgi:protein-S-isoprenylcysteine O-methyltransferase Ste14